MNIDYFKNNKEILNILLVTLLIFSMIILFNIYGWKLNQQKPKEILQVVTIETFDNIDKKINDIEIRKEINSLNLDQERSFCQNNYDILSSKDLEKKCNNLTNENCNKVNCCVWVNNGKCSSGGIDGPTFKTDVNGNLITIDNFYYKNKCYGKNCS